MKQKTRDWIDIIVIAACILGLYLAAFAALAQAPQYPNQPCANGYDVPFGLTPIYLDASTLETPWFRVSYGVARLRSNLE